METKGTILINKKIGTQDWKESPGPWSPVPNQEAVCMVKGSTVWKHASQLSALTLELKAVQLH